MAFSKETYARSRRHARAIAVREPAQAATPTLMKPHRSASPTRAGDPLDPAFAGMFASKGSADSNWLRDRLVAIPKIRRLVEDEPLAASAVEQKLALMFGDQLTFASSPLARAFGLEDNDPQIAALGRSIEAAWRRWATDPLCRCDWEQQLDFDGLIDLTTRHRLIDGEPLVLVNALPEAEAWPYQTALQVLDPDRLATPAGAVESDQLRAGVRFDERGRAEAYHILDGHPHDYGLSFKGMTGRWYPRWDTDVPGRPRVLHYYKKRRAGQSRGISQFVSVLSRLQSLSDLNEAELRSRVLNALIFASISSSMDGEYVQEMFSDGGAADQLLEHRNAFYNEAGIRVGGNRVIQTFPGDELQINHAQRDANAFADTLWAVAVQGGAGLGLPAEVLSQDFTKTTYTSGRLSLGSAFRGLARERSLDIKYFARPVLLCVLQEAYELGDLDLPANAPHPLERPDAYAAGSWLGGRPISADPVKDAMGDRLRLENGVAAPSDIAAEHGQDFDQLVSKIKRDKEKLTEAGIEMGDIATLGAAAQLAGSD